ncbi:hypothetical protein J1N35_040684 [Gossypium stocksii]|uniref:Uncharacterized protein n=1 Tax=Gossypium stocksii TaxID=47602 RepID=A0A9D3UEB5_9ROSI|nr:hypothetical protein J1N35_040684 [Gossypium stocksii]
MDAIDSVFDPLREFAKDSVRLVKRCHKPDRKALLHVTDSQEGQELVEIFNTEIKERTNLVEASIGLNEFYVQANSVLDDNPMKYP